MEGEIGSVDSIKVSDTSGKLELDKITKRVCAEYGQNMCRVRIERRISIISMQRPVRLLGKLHTPNDIISMQSEYH